MGYFYTWVQMNPMTKKVYTTAKKIKRKNQFSLMNLNQLVGVKSQEQKMRINLLLPTLNKYKFFGGISTALKFYELLSEQLQVDVRIIVTRKEKYNEKFSKEFEGYTINQSNGSKRVSFLSDNNHLEIRKQDIFLCTSWDTAYIIQSALEWQRKTYQLERVKLLYLIQDYEPGFYAWSTEYMLAESTYKSNKGVDLVGIFNSKQLYDFFELRGYYFWRKMYFTPSLNENLAEFLEKNQGRYKRKKRILLYGRPGTERNAFELIIHSLRLWAKKYEKADEWEVISLGENFEDIKVGEKVVLRCLGKATLEDYGRIMMESYIGISLMVSPHPSYPPLEMSTYGIKTITNTFENKELSSFNDNIISLDKCTPESICRQLIKICRQYPSQIATVYDKSDYVKGNDSMNQVIRELVDILK